jgi:histidyl-tRNA synthetase
MSYADKLSFPFAVLLGEDEIAQGKCALKNMQTGEQALLSYEEAANAILASRGNQTTVILEQ